MADSQLLSRSTILRFFVYLSLLVYFSTFTSGDEEIELASIELEDETELKQSDFVPTEEWQTVGDDDVLPRGLHIRMNLQTGKKEAKLLDQGDAGSCTDEESAREPFGDRRRLDHYGHSDRCGIVNKKTAAFTKDGLRDALRYSHSTSTGDDPSSEVMLLSQDSTSLDSEAEGVRLSAPSHEASTSDSTEQVQFEGPGSTLLTKEQEAMMACFRYLRNNTLSEELAVTNLEELEYFVHSFHNGEFFADSGGFSLVLKFINHSSSDVSSTAAQVIGSAVQSNPGVKQLAMRLGVLEALLPTLQPDQTDLQQRRSLYAVASMLRRHTEAQERFIVGLKGFEAVVDQAQGRSARYLLKAVVVLTDIMNELHEDISENAGSSKMDAMRVHLVNALASSEWCPVIVGLLNSNDPNQIEKVLEGMLACCHVCDFSLHLAQLLELRSRIENTGDPMRAGLLDLTTDVVAAVEKQLFLRE